MKRFLVLILTIVGILSFSGCSGNIKESPLENIALSIEKMDSLLDHSLSFSCSSLNVKEDNVTFDDWNSGTMPGIYSLFSLEGTLMLDFDIQDTYHQKVYALRFRHSTTSLDETEKRKIYNQLYDEIVKDYGEATSRLFISGESDSDYWEITRNKDEALVLSVFLDPSTNELVIKYGYKTFL